MRILFVNGGPRKGNTWKLAAYVQNYVRAVFPGAEVEEIQLKDMKLPFCTGCSLCFRVGHEKCPHYGKMRPLLEALERCDGLVFAAPTNYMAMPALTKNLVDHLSFLFHRPCFFTKKALVISTTGGVGAQQAVAGFAGTLQGWGFNKCWELPVISTSWNNYQPAPAHLQNLRRVTRSFLLDTASGKRHMPSYSLLIPYNLFRGMSLSYRPGTEYENRDGSFWMEEGRAERAYGEGIPLSPGRRLFGNLWYQMAKALSPHMIVSYKK